MERFDLEELSAMLQSSTVVHSRGRDLVNRLENLHSKVGELLSRVKNNQVDLDALSEEVSRISDSLDDTETIIHLLSREKKLVSKLAEIDRSFIEKETDKNLDEFMEDMFGKQIDPETKKRVEQLIDLNQLIDSVTVESDGESKISRLEKLKELLELVKPLAAGLTGRVDKKINKRARPNVRVDLKQADPFSESRPYRRVNALGPSSKGEAYKTPRKRS